MATKKELKEFEEQAILNEVQRKSFEPRFSDDVPNKSFVKPKKDTLSSFGSCGHVNNQSYGIDGELSPLTCELEKDHYGDHEADYEALRNSDIVIERVYWSDAANTNLEVVKVSEELKERKAEAVIELKEAAEKFERAQEELESVSNKFDSVEKDRPANAAVKAAEEAVVKAKAALNKDLTEAGRARAEQDLVEAEIELQRARKQNG